MKKIIAFIPTWLLYYIGDFICTINLYNTSIGWRIYNWYMRKSLSIQDWAELSKPWEKVK